MHEGMNFDHDLDLLSDGLFLLFGRYMELSCYSSRRQCSVTVLVARCDCINQNQILRSRSDPRPRICRRVLLRAGWILVYTVLDVYALRIRYAM